MDKDVIRTVFSRDTKHHAHELRMSNIRAFASLDRTGLAYGDVERLLLLHETSGGEKLYIQFPGKETVSGKPEKIRPWDFRPKLQLPDGSFIDDLTFPNIWDDLAAMHDDNQHVLAVLAAIFFRMAFMIGYRHEENTYTYTDIDIKEQAAISHGHVVFSWYKPSFNANLLAEMQKTIGLIRGVSLEAYLIYNDLLVQNEDCKYYYRAVEVEDGQWNDKAGRRNTTLLSHISVIEFLQGKITFSEIMQRFQSGRGIAPIPEKRIPDVTEGIISKE